MSNKSRIRISREGKVHEVEFPGPAVIDLAAGEIEWTDPRSEVTCKFGLSKILYFAEIGHYGVKLIRSAAEMDEIDARSRKAISGQTVQID